MARRRTESAGVLVATTTPADAPIVMGRAWSIPATIASGEIGRLMTRVYQEVDPADVARAQSELLYISFSVTAEYTDLAGRQRERMTIVAQARHLPHGAHEHAQLPPRYEQIARLDMIWRFLTTAGANAWRWIRNSSERWNWNSMPGIRNLPNRRR